MYKQRRSHKFKITEVVSPNKIFLMFCLFLNYISLVNSSTILSVASISQHFIHCQWMRPHCLLVAVSLCVHQIHQDL